MFVILLLALLGVAPTAEAHPRKLSQLEEIPHQIRPMVLLGSPKPLRLLAGYPVSSMENISWHTKSLRRVARKPDPKEKEGRVFDVSAPVRVHKLQVSAYTSRRVETDSTPFITATGEWVRWGIVASNKFPLGTRLRFPELYGNEEFVVEDCMNERYKNSVDIWLPSLDLVPTVGSEERRVEVVKLGKKRMCYSS